MFVTAIDHSNVIFCLRFIWEKRSGLWSRWGRELLSQSCGLEAAGQTGNFKDGATQLFVFQHLCPYELGDLFGTPVTMEKCKWCLLGRESTRRGPRPHPSEDKAFASRATYAYEITSDYLAKGFLIDSGRCLADCAPMGRPPFSLRAQEEGRKNHLRDPPPPPPNALQPRRNASPGERAIRQQRQFKHWAHFWDCCKGWQFIARFNDRVCDMHTCQLGTGVRSMSYFT